MAGNRGIGALLRDLRRARELTLAAVAKQVGCAESQLSYVESGRRTLHSWLAGELDRVYQAGGVITGMLHELDQTSRDRSSAAILHADVLLAPSPDGGPPMPISRRDLLAYLGTGTLSAPVISWLESAGQTVEPDHDTLNRAGEAFDSYQAAGRTLPARTLIDAMTGRVALLDYTRRRVSSSLRPWFLTLQARFAESLSWFSEEAGDPAGTLFWIDRASQWAQSCDWVAMAGYTFVRRSMTALSFHNDVGRAIEEARLAFEHPRVPPRVRGLAAKQMAFSYALRWKNGTSVRFLDDAVCLLGHEIEDASEPGQRSVADDDLYALYRATCEVYLGHGNEAITLLEPKLSSLSTGSERTGTITQAKLAHAYANVGQPREAVRCVTRALDAHAVIQSQSAYRELRRALPVLSQWRDRSDVAAAIERVRDSSSTCA